VKGYVLKNQVASDLIHAIQQVCISVKTAESHRMRLMQKLDIHETASLVRYAVRRGLIKP
jgi:FixJ family two-component response regulator